MKVISKHECTFAAKSGGHSMWAGASSAPGGVTIDLVGLDGVEVVDGDEFEGNGGKGIGNGERGDGGKKVAKVGKG